MARPREFDEQRALTAAMEVFWEKGYEATSLTDLTSRMGIQRPSLYAAFGDKQTLFNAALDRYAELSQAYIRGLMDRASSAREAIRAYFERMLDDAYADRPYAGCLCVNTMVELAPHDSRLADYTKAYQAKLAELFRKKLEESKADGQLPAGLDAGTVANTLMIAAVGLNVTLKSKPDRGTVEPVVKQILAMLD